MVVDGTDDPFFLKCMNAPAAATPMRTRAPTTPPMMAPVEELPCDSVVTGAVINSTVTPRAALSVVGLLRNSSTLATTADEMDWSDVITTTSTLTEAAETVISTSISATLSN